MSFDVGKLLKNGMGWDFQNNLFLYHFKFKQTNMKRKRKTYSSVFNYTESCLHWNILILPGTENCHCISNTHFF